MMCVRQKTSFLLGLALMVTTAADYTPYYVERDCPSGSLNLSLSAVGSGSSVLLGVSDVRPTYTLAMDCTIQITSPHPRHIVVVAIRELGFRFKADGTCQDYLKILDTKCERLFSLDEERHYFSEGSSLTLFYHVSSQGLDNATPTDYPGFKVTVTTATKGSSCSGEGAFRCANDLCVWSGLRCDTHNNCGDLSDEQDCGSPAGGGSTVLIILGVLILLLLVIMCLTTMLCSKNETVRRFSNRLRTRTISYMRRFSR